MQNLHPDQVLVRTPKWSSTLASIEAVKAGRVVPGMEAMMPERSSMHFYLNWAKERIDEMDATLASLEAQSRQVQADSKVKANQLIADLKKRRDEFQADVKKQAEAGEAAWERTKAQLESQWNGFEALVKTYIDTVGKQVEQQQATFRGVAAAQVKAWREAADKFRGAATKLAAARRADLDAAVKQMKADASETEEQLQKLKEAGRESWTALSAALAESRKAFDRANQAAWDALKRAAPPQS
jgi:chromosome segregation ATPase